MRHSRKRKTIAFILTLAMVLTLLPTAVLAVPVEPKIKTITSSETYGDAYSAEKAFDRDGTTRFAAKGENTPAWIEVEFAAPVSFRQLTAVEYVGSYWTPRTQTIRWQLPKTVSPGRT